MQAVAAILLVLHWILPAAWQAGPVQAGRGMGLGELGPGYVSGLWASQPLNLPRIQPRTVSLDSSDSKRGEPFLAAGAAAAVQIRATVAARPDGEGRSIAPATAAAVHSAASDAFDARGPPLPA